MTRWSNSTVQALAVDAIDERFGRYRLGGFREQESLEESLREFGQLSPLVCCRRDEAACLIDGYRRLQAARRIGFEELNVLYLDVDNRGAKAAMYRLNQSERRVHILEEAWIIQSLVREDGLMQQEVAELMGRHKSWVCRRLALLEKLVPTARQDLQLGLLSPSAARELLRLPHGNQLEFLECIRRESLTVAEIRELVDLLLASSTREQREFILEKPRQALAQARGGPQHHWDPRLSQAGNRLSRRLASLLDQLARMENWLRHSGRADLSLCDCSILAPGLERLARDAGVVSELTTDFVEELKLP